MSDIFGDEEVVEPTEAAAPEVVEEVVEETPVKEPVVVKQDSTVPLSALNESRAQLRQTQAELNQIKEQVAQFQKLKEEIETYRQERQRTVSENDFNSDPLGALRKQLADLQTNIVTKQQESEQNQTKQAEAQQAIMAIATQVTEFKKTVPDYDDALNHVFNQRKAELMAMGLTDMDAQNRVAGEAQEIGFAALRSGRNPGEVVYELAKVRGYDAKRVATKLEVVEKGQKASSSLSGASGNAGDKGFSLSEIDNMSDDEFDKFWEKEMKPRRR